MKLFKRNNYVLSSSFALACLISSHEVMAVGGGLLFNVDEIFVDGADPNEFNADSMDFTYHACTDIGGANGKRLRENGYFWISSYQDAVGVVDSQINYFDTEGYHIYGRYSYQAGQVSPLHPDTHRGSLELRSGSGKRVHRALRRSRAGYDFGSRGLPSRCHQ